MKKKNELKAIWDRDMDGWYFRMGFGHSEIDGIAPGQGGLTNPKMTKKRLHDEALIWAEWNGVDASNMKFVVTRK